MEKISQKICHDVVKQYLKENFFRKIYSLLKEAFSESFSQKIKRNYGFESEVKEWRNSLYDLLI